MDKGWISPRRVMDASCPSINPENQSFIKEKEKNGRRMEEREMLAIHQSNRKSIIHPSRKKGIMVAGWRPPRRKGDASYLSINQTRNSFIHQGK